MTKEEEKLVFKDLTARLDYGVKVKALGWDEDKQEEVYVDLEVYSVNRDMYVTLSDGYEYDINDVRIDAIQLYLRPLFSDYEISKDAMSEQEKKDYDALFNEVDGHDECETYDWLDFMNSHHFDYRGLIKKGLALEAPKGMYNI